MTFDATYTISELRVLPFWKLTTVHVMDLHNAAKTGDQQRMVQLIGMDALCINLRDRLSRTPLHLAAWAGQLVRVLAQTSRLLTAVAALQTPARHRVLLVCTYSNCMACT